MQDLPPSQHIEDIRRDIEEKKHDGFLSNDERTAIRTQLLALIYDAEKREPHNKQIHEEITKLAKEVQEFIRQQREPMREKTLTTPVLSEADETEIRKSTGELVAYREQNKQDTDIFNRTFPGRLDDHIQFLKDIGVSRINSYFIDIGPGVGDFHDAEKKIRPEYPAITSLEMAKALRNNHTIALDLPESVDVLMRAREQDRKIGGDLLGRDDIQVVPGNGLKGLRAQLESTRDVLGKSVKLPDIDDVIVIRACNSIDIYSDWSDVKPALKKMSEDFKEHRMILFFGKKILAKEAGKTNFTIIGDISDRGFNHNEQTTKHVPDTVPAYSIRDNNLDFGQFIDLKSREGDRKKGVFSTRETRQIQDTPENVGLFFEELQKSDDPKIRETGVVLNKILSELSEKEKILLIASTPHMHVVDKGEKQRFYATYGHQKPQSEYQMVVNVDEGGQKAYLLNPSGEPKIVFDISSGKSYKTPTGEFQLQTKDKDYRTIPFRRFGQAYHKQGPDGILDWDGGAQMTTAILAMNMGPNIYFHGTNKEKNLGKRDSGGCIRMDNISIAFLSILFETQGIKNVSIVEKREGSDRRNFDQ